MELTEHLIPASSEKQSWVGSTRFDLSGASGLKIESPGVDHLDFQVPDGETYRFELDLRIVKIYD